MSQISDFRSPSARRFDRAAPDYRHASEPQQDAASALMELLPRDMSSPRILEIGCGTGHLTTALNAHFPDSELTAIDPAPGMLKVASRHLNAHPLVHFHQASWPDFSPAGAVELVASASALHWVEPMDAGLKALAPVLAPQGLLAIAVMVKGTLTELQSARAVVVKTLEKDRHLPREEHLLDVLRPSFDLLEQRVFQKTYYQPTMRAVWQALISQGVNGERFAVAEPRLSPREVKAVADEYIRLHNHPVRGLPMTYRSLLLVGRKKG